MWHVTYMLPPDAILGSKCTKSAFAADPAGGSLQRSPDTLAVFEGTSSRQGRGGKGRGRMGGKGNGPSQLWEQIDVHVTYWLLSRLCHDCSQRDPVAASCRCRVNGGCWPRDAATRQCPRWSAVRCQGPWYDRWSSGRHLLWTTDQGNVMSYLSYMSAAN